LEVLAASAGAAWRALVATADAARADRESAAARLMLSGALRLAGLGSWSWDPASGVVTLDDRLREMLGFPLSEPDPDLESWRARIHPDDRGPFTGVEDPAAHAGTSAPYPFRVSSSDGGERTFLGMSVPLATTSSSVVQGLVLDVSAGEKSTGELVRLAQCDSLTGLANRSVLDVRLAEALERATPQDAVALVLLDLDRFKLVNDTLGHQIGDALLRQVAVRLEDAAPPGAVLARLGGDEFVVMVPGVNRVEAASLMARDVLRRLRSPMLLPGLPEPFVCTSSAGIAIGHEGTADDLFRSADMALYRAKDGGRDRVAVYDSAMREEAQARHVAEHRVRRALRTDGLRVVWQPIVDLRTSELVAAEALVRLDDPVEGILEPKYFVDTAEDTGLIVDVDTWVLGEVLRQLREWRREGVGLQVSFNVSGKTLEHPAFAHRLARTHAHRPVDVDAGEPGGAAQHRRPRRSRRLRDGVLLAVLPRQVPAELPQDRHELRAPPRFLRPRRGRRAGPHQPRPRPRHGRHRRGRGERAAGEDVAGHGVRPRPGVPVRPPRRGGPAAQRSVRRPTAAVAPGPAGRRRRRCARGSAS
jgi:diguanylate cyclase (GGDEF)-like protein